MFHITEHTYSVRISTYHIQQTCYATCMQYKPHTYANTLYMQHIHTFMF